MYNGYVTADELLSFIQTATSELRAAGYTGIISTAETVGTYQDNPSLCDAADEYLHANIHGYYDPSCTSSEAGSFVVSQQSLVETLCGKSVIVSETGWPSGGGSDVDAVASSSDQATAIASINSATKGQVTYFSYANDEWKLPVGPEQYFGMTFQYGCF